MSVAAQNTVVHISYVLKDTKGEILDQAEALSLIHISEPTRPY